MQAFVKKDTLEIIVTTRSVWHTPGEYTTLGYACIQFDCPDDMQLARVTSIGEPSPHDPGEIYLSPDVELEPVPEVDNG